MDPEPTRSAFPLARIGGFLGAFAVVVFPLFDDLPGRDTGYGHRIVEIVSQRGFGAFGWLVLPVLCAFALFVVAMVVPARHRSLRILGIAAACATAALLFGIERLALKEAIEPAWGIYAAVGASLLVVLDGWLWTPRPMPPPKREDPAGSAAAWETLVHDLKRNPAARGTAEAKRR